MSRSCSVDTSSQSTSTNTGADELDVDLFGIIDCTFPDYTNEETLKHKKLFETWLFKVYKTSESNESPATSESPATELAASTEPAKKPKRVINDQKGKTSSALTKQEVDNIIIIVNNIINDPNNFNKSYTPQIKFHYIHVNILILNY
jgi:hypothetical protein